MFSHGPDFPAVQCQGRSRRVPTASAAPFQNGPLTAWPETPEGLMLSREKGMPWVGPTWETMCSSEASLNLIPRMRQQVEYPSKALRVTHPTP